MTTTEQAADLSIALATPVEHERAVQHTWARSYGRRLLATDAVIVATSLVVALRVRFGDADPLVSAAPADVVGVLRAGYATFSLAVFAVWMLALALSGTRSPHIVGSGRDEYKRVLVASFRIFGALAIGAYVLKAEIARGYVAIAFPLGLLGLLTSRRLWRMWLQRRREAGAMASRVAVIGDKAEAFEFQSHLQAHPRAGLSVIGAFEPLPEMAEPGFWVAHVADGAQALGVDAVAVMPSARTRPEVQQELLWALERYDIDLLMASSLSGVSGPRIHSRPVEGLSMVHIEGAHYRGAMRVVKNVFDRCLAALALVGMSPLLAIVAVLVKTTSSGPVFYRQERVGLNGRTFQIWKFRSMRVDADAELMYLLQQQGTDGQPLFKLDHDPRVTRFGQFIRKYSIDELPQLLNIVTGDMSLVGPRPQRPAEVALYDRLAARRLKTKPGVTGLWQVSGRSDLPWDQAVRLDIHYVDNWSFLFDLQLMWRTLFIVARGSGAR